MQRWKIPGFCRCVLLDTAVTIRCMKFSHSVCAVDMDLNLWAGWYEGRRQIGVKRLIGLRMTG